MDRQEANLILLNELYTLVLNNPDLRFGQILANFGYVNDQNSRGDYGWENEFYLESESLLKRVDKEIKTMKENTND